MLSISAFKVICDIIVALVVPSHAKGQVQGEDRAFGMSLGSPTWTFFMLAPSATIGLCILAGHLRATSILQPRLDSQFAPWGSWRQRPSCAAGAG